MPSPAQYYAQGRPLGPGRTWRKDGLQCGLDCLVLCQGCISGFRVLQGFLSGFDKGPLNFKAFLPGFYAGLVFRAVGLGIREQVFVSKLLLKILQKHILAAVSVES